MRIGAPEIESILTRRHDRLMYLNIELLQAALRFLKIATPLVLASELEGVCGQSTERLISIGRAVAADEYLSGAGGKNYHDEAAFQAAGIRLVYSDFAHPVYPQLHGEFIPQLSAVDYLFNVPSRDQMFGKLFVAA